MTEQNLPALIEALERDRPFGHPVEQFQHIETHISHVLLTGQFAYKFKKSIDLGFLDFSSLEKRRHCCEEEIRLNRRLASDLYLEVVRITGNVEHPSFDGEGDAFEYAVKMRQFDHAALLDAEAKAGTLSDASIDELIDIMLDFHANVPATADDSEFGTPDRVMVPVRHNFDQIRPLLETPQEQADMRAVEDWCELEFSRIRAALSRRRAEGRIRECHGDLHLGNIARIGGRAVPFDAIEFNPALRWIDVISELAFLLMDLDGQGLERLSHRALDRYLEASGDHDALEVLPFYLCYRAMVRAKVARLRSAQATISASERIDALQQYQGRIEQARTYSQGRAPSLTITCGVSGSGKTFASQRVLEELGGVRVRSDVERKRLFGLAPLADSRGGPDIYTPDASERTYQRLLSLAESIINNGYPAVVDATFLKRAHRMPFQALATKLNVPYRIVHMDAPAEELRSRIRARSAAGDDASEATVAVMERQLENWEPLGEEERNCLVPSPAF